ncbi:transposase [Trueperella pyogenes]|nr:transposase [Trueperella pyogenes]
MNDLATLGIGNLSKSQVSEMAKKFDEIISDCRARLAATPNALC